PLGGQWSTTTASHTTEESSFRRYSNCGGLMMQGTDSRVHCRIVSSRLDPQRPLTNRGKKVAFIKDVAVWRHQPQTFQSCRCQNSRVHYPFTLFAQSRINVTAQDFN